MFNLGTSSSESVSRRTPPPTDVAEQQPPEDLPLPDTSAASSKLPLAQEVQTAEAHPILGDLPDAAKESHADTSHADSKTGADASTLAGLTDSVFASSASAATLLPTVAPVRQLLRTPHALHSPDQHETFARAMQAVREELGRVDTDLAGPRVSRAQLDSAVRRSDAILDWLRDILRP